MTEEPNFYYNIHLKEGILERFNEICLRASFRLD